MAGLGPMLGAQGSPQPGAQAPGVTSPASLLSFLTALRSGGAQNPAVSGNGAAVGQQSLTSLLPLLLMMLGQSGAMGSPAGLAGPSPTGGAPAPPQSANPLEALLPLLQKLGIR